MRVTAGKDKGKPKQLRLCFLLDSFRMKHNVVLPAPRGACILVIG